MGFSIKYAVILQEESVTIDEATRNFGRSCEYCSKIGYNMSCDRCPVAKAHHDKLDAIISLRQAEQHKKMQREKELQRIKDLEEEALTIYLACRCCQDVLVHSSELERLADKFLLIKGEM